MTFPWPWRTQVAPPPSVPVRVEPSFRIPDTAIGRSRTFGKPVVAQDAVFTLPTHPPGVGPAPDASGKSGLAMDSGVAAPQAWANQALASYFTNGVTFLGYAYLAELAQRPEYRMISEVLATEMTREWIKFTVTAKDGDDAKEEKIAELTSEFERLNVRDIFCRAVQQDGFFGRAHIYVDTGDTDDDNELKQSIGDGWDAISEKKVSHESPVKALRTVEAVWCYPTNYNSNDPLKDNWYRPDQWYVQAKITHSSRLITLIGREVPDLLKPTYSFGGLSMSQLAKPYVDNWLQTRQGVNDIIDSFSVFALMTNLGVLTQNDGSELFKRAELFNNLRSNAGLMILDKNTEDFKNVSAPLGGLSDLQAQAQEHMCSVAHIPTVKLLGIQPAGLNADSEGVMRAFYDYVHAYQEHLLRKPLHRLLGLVMLSLWDEVDPDISFDFVPLFALTEKEQGEVDKLKAERDQILIDAGSIAPEESRKRIAAEPDSDFASIDVEDVPDLEKEEAEGLVPKGGGSVTAAAEAGEGGTPPKQKEAA